MASRKKQTVLPPVERQAIPPQMPNQAGQIPLDVDWEAMKRERDAYVLGQVPRLGTTEVVRPDPRQGSTSVEYVEAPPPPPGWLSREQIMEQAILAAQQLRGIPARRSVAASIQAPLPEPEPQAGNEYLQQGLSQQGTLVAPKRQIQGAFPGSQFQWPDQYEPLSDSEMAIGASEAARTLRQHIPGGSGYRPEGVMYPDEVTPKKNRKVRQGTSK